MTPPSTSRAALTLPRTSREATERETAGGEHEAQTLDASGTSAQRTENASMVDAAELAAVERWLGERLVEAGDDAAEALAPGTAWRAIYDAARTELVAGLAVPSPAFRRAYALPLGLQRILASDPPRLASGLELRPHQVDALAGMLAALLGNAERASAGAASGAEPDDDELEPDVLDDAEQDDAARALEAQLEAIVFEDEDDAPEALPEAFEDDDLDDDDEDDELEDDADEEGDDDEVGAADDVVDEIDDPGASRRYRFKHPTASGKTVAAAGFVEAARLTGVLILTHRRLLVDQFKRDLAEQGYAFRLREPVLGDACPPLVPPVTIETYAWFIKHADEISQDTYGVILCDEAHTALGDKTSASIRRLQAPTYIGMTATDELLQKHVGDVFPIEIDDFPLDEAVRSGVVAPLRAVRVKQPANLKRVRIVGGDFDQQELAQALDHDPLNMAAALLYLERFGNRPGIVYTAGVDHAYRVAAQMRAVGIKAAAVSGRTPPRELANTLAAYERGEINVLVNAQLLAEGWNAPRATVCMHLAPTASKRVYQQRLGRIMRLHRRKEAGVVVDFADPAAPHTDRTVTVHSLLGVEVYQPGALVTPRSPKRRARWRKSARPLVREEPWLLPVTPDPLRRRQLVLEHWKLVSVERLPRDEQELWAENAGRRVNQKDVIRLARALSAVPIQIRMLFFATCAAENKNRALRLMALGDLAQHRPDANVFERAVRLVEAAPTWRLDRAQGARTLLLALGDGRVDASSDRVAAWTWRLARASREAQFRRVLQAFEGGRDLAKALASAQGEQAMRAAARMVQAALKAPLDLGAALLAVALTHDASALRLIEGGRMRLSGEPTLLAAALGSNIPLPRAARRQEPQRPKPAKPARPAPVAAAPADEDGDAGGKRRRRRRRRRRGGAGEGGAEVEVLEGVETTVDDGEATDAGDGAATAMGAPAVESPAAPPADGDADGETEPASAPKRRRRRRSRSGGAGADGAGEAAVEPVEATVEAVEAPAEPAPEAPAEPASAPRALRPGLRRVVIDDEPESAPPPPAPAAPARRRSRRGAAPAPAAAAPAVPVEAAPAEEPAAPVRRRRSRAAAPAAEAVAAVEASAPPAEEPVTRPRRSRRAAPAPAAEASPAPAAVEPAAVEPPAPARRSRRATAAAPAATTNGAATPAKPRARKRAAADAPPSGE